MANSALRKPRQMTLLLTFEPYYAITRQHLLECLNYTDDCFLLFGRVIGHNPDAHLDIKKSQQRIGTTKIAFQARYGEDRDTEVWSYGNGDSWGEPMDIDMDSAPAPSTPHNRGRLPVARTASPTRTTPIVADESTSPVPTRGTTSPRSPKSPTGNDPITIFLRDSASGEETYFSLRYRSTLRIVFTVFAERKGLVQDTLKFAFNGQTLTGYETPYSLGLEDRARIDVNITRK